MNYTIGLASKSPRRRQILENLGLSFSLKSQEMDENYPADLNLAEVPLYLAEKKASGFLGKINDDELIITADTVVVVENKILNKPENEVSAQQMLATLSGKTHQVITGVCLLTTSKKISFSDTTEVYFRTLEKKEIDFYIQHYQPFDKAGAYAIQEWIGMIGIEKIVGSYFNVVGLPVEKLYQALKRFGIELL